MTEEMNSKNSQQDSSLRAKGGTWDRRWDPSNYENGRIVRQRWPGLASGENVPVRKAGIPTNELPGGPGYDDESLPASCEPVWTPRLFDDIGQYANLQPITVSPEPIIDGLYQLSGWPDDAIFAVPPGSEDGMAPQGPSISSIEQQELCLLLRGDPNIPLLELEASCSPESGGLEYGAGQRFFSDMSPCTAYSNSPVSFIPAGRVSTGDGQAAHGAKHGNWGDSWWDTDAIRDEGAGQRGRNSGAFLAPDSVWMDDVFHQSPEASYSGADFLAPTYSQPPGAFSPVPGNKSAESTTWENSSYQQSYLHCQGPELPIANQGSPFMAGRWSSLEDLSTSQAMMPMVSANLRRLEQERSKRLDDRPPTSLASGPQRPTLQRHPPTKASVQYLPPSERALAPRMWPPGDGYPGMPLHHPPHPHPRVGQRQDEKNMFLVRSKLAGMSYKEIRDRGNFKEAESTLRGRFRTLTKDKERRVRKPEWEERDIRLLREAVAYVKREVRSASTATGPSLRSSTRPTSGGSKVPWKLVAEYIANNGGSYHFGNATCRKKWDEIKAEER